MVKYILVMIICSGIPGNQCKPIPVPVPEFDKYHECIIYGYDYSSTMLKSLNPKTMNEVERVTAVDCQERMST